MQIFSDTQTEINEAILKLYPDLKLEDLDIKKVGTEYPDPREYYHVRKCTWIAGAFDNVAVDHDGDEWIAERLPMHFH